MDILWTFDSKNFLNSLWHLISLPTLNQHLLETYDILETEPIIKELVDKLVEKEISGPIFRDFIH